MIGKRLDEVVDCLYRVTTRAIIIRDRKLLVAPGPGDWWKLPGGVIDHGEGVLDSLARELHEELGIPDSKIMISPAPASVTTEHNPSSPKSLPCANIYFDVDPRRVELEFTWVDAYELKKLLLGFHVNKSRDFLLARLKEAV